jgi:nicotinate phosphoribosyltransferase
MPEDLIQEGPRGLERMLIATESEIKQGRTTDVYFLFTEEILRKKGINTKVVMEFYARAVPEGDWGIVSGIYEVMKLLDGVKVDVRAMEEGTLFLTNRNTAVYEPVLQVEGSYTEFAKFENPALGFLCTMSGVATRAAKLRIAARDRTLLSFGSRRVHPALAPAVEWSAFIGGADGVSNVIGAEMIGERPVGTMPHSLVLILGDQKKAWKAFDEVVPKDIPRIALIDTLSDEKTEALMAADTLGERLQGVRIDTPGSRKGNLRKIVEEVRWELNIRGRHDVKIFVSGGLGEAEIAGLSDIADGFGVGTYISDAPSVDFSGKVVEIVEADGTRIPRAKRGDISGKKQVYRDWKTLADVVQPEATLGPKGSEPLLTPIMRNGEVVRDFLRPREIRERTKKQLEMLRDHQPSLSWAVPR